MKPGLPDYGLDAPNLVRFFLIGGFLLLALGLALVLLSTDWLTAVGSIVFTFGVIFTIEGLLMIWSSRYGKLRARDRLLDGLELTGEEKLLDVGCGRGLLLIGQPAAFHTGVPSAWIFGRRWICRITAHPPLWRTPLPRECRSVLRCMRVTCGNCRLRTPVLMQS